MQQVCNKGLITYKIVIFDWINFINSYYFIEQIYVFYFIATN